MGIRLPVERAWDGFCNHFAELQKQGRTIAETSDGRYRITLDARSTSAHVMVFDYDEVVYDETLMTKNQFEDELVYLYDFYVETYEKEEEDEDFSEDNVLIPTGASGIEADLLIDDLLSVICPGISMTDPFYEDMRDDVLNSIKEVMLGWGFPAIV